MAAKIQDGYQFQDGCPIKKYLQKLTIALTLCFFSLLNKIIPFLIFFKMASNIQDGCQNSKWLPNSKLFEKIDHFTCYKLKFFSFKQ